MTPQFHPSLVNGPFDDPALYIDFLHDRRALLFDLGDIRALPPRKILRLTHIFISHTHIDHFIGFDYLLRLFLGREKRLQVFGPPGFVDRVEHRLASYTWNLVEGYPSDFTLSAVELHPDGGRISAEFHCRSRFRREFLRNEQSRDGILLDEETFRIRAAFLDHGIPCLAFALEEKSHVNIMKNRLMELGLPTGVWLGELKREIARGAADDRDVTAWWKVGGKRVERRFSLGELKEKVLRIVPGQKIAYVTDAACTPSNAAKIIDLAHGADYLFIEAPFLDGERERAGRRSHLTARQAGVLGRQAGVARVIPFHFSPRHLGEEERLRREVEV
jgi:ribonuclease Z